MAYLSANIAELSGDTKHELVLLSHWLVDITSQTSTLLSLQSHIGICDLGQRREEEDNSEAEHEGGDTKICPLYLGEIIGLGVGEEDACSEERCHD